MKLGRKEIMYIIFFIGAIGYALYSYVIDPRLMEHNNNKMEIERLTKELEEARRNARKLSQILEQSERVKAHLEATRKILVEKIEVEGLFKLFAPLFQKAGIDQKKELLGIRRAGKVVGDFYVEDKWLISLQVPFDKLSYLLYEFYAYERLLDVTALVLNIAGQTEQGIPIVRVDLPVSTYTYRTEESS